MSFKVEVHGLKNFSEKHRQKMSAAIIELERVANSPEFMHHILVHEFDDQTNGKTNEELYEHFMSGSTKFHEAKDNDLDLMLTSYYSWKSVIGYTYPSTWFTWINRKFIPGFSLGDLAGNVTHEDRHNAGYGHRKASDHDSVPYAFGYIMRDLINGKIPPVSYTNRKRPTRIRRRRRWYSYLNPRNWF